MRCPRCDALNADTAAWCTQCFAVVGAASAPTGPDPAPAAGPPTGPAAPPAGSPPPSGGEVRGIRTRDGAVERRCPGCGRWVDLMVATCPHCGTPRTGFELDRPGGAHAAGDPLAVRWPSALLPGAGHWQLGQQASAVARGLLTVLWLSGAVLLLQESAGRLPGVLLLVGATLLWVLSFLGARRLSAGDRDLLDTRRLTWLVIGVTGTLVLMMVSTGFGAVG